MDSHTPGMQLTYPNRTTITRTVGVFVDDTNSGLTQDALRTFNPPHQSPVQKHNTVYDQTAANVQFYSDLLTASGGKMALHKSYVYVLKTTWRNGTRRLEETQKYLPSMSIK